MLKFACKVEFCECQVYDRPETKIQIYVTKNVQRQGPDLHFPNKQNN